MKLIMADILINYGVGLVNQNAPRSWVWRTTVTPRGDARVVFKRRHAPLA